MDTDKLLPWLTNIISALVSNPDDISIDQVEDSMGLLFTVRVHKEDQGKVIGKEGNIANAIRVLLRSAGRSCDVRASMKIDAGTNFELNKEAR